MDSVEFILQLLSTIFAVLGILVTIGGTDTRWSIAAVLYRRLCREDIDWEAERRRWQDTYRIDMERQPPQSNVPFAPPRSWCNASDATIVTHRRTILEPEHNEDIGNPLQRCSTLTQTKSKQRSELVEKTIPITSVTHLERQASDHQDTPTKSQHVRYVRKVTRPHPIVRSHGRESRRWSTATSKDSVNISEVCNAMV
ncbi:hypothetical protein BU25DRAFT_460463 [Macroventuria anomochaeta]|uniref:Uncharacterized protein n=1 Tax=Macroventuria anomochaeta TaxID=301207 RepID=A0ACB6RUD3_9PLEO|nr:uncharacterized protein BU25DRAFT_460463 [Macroventuria anomochaeta]KAF2625348.1 hypothetical protein BU25DRAFT_460463 [Macroventuria anomochaeta]